MRLRTLLVVTTVITISAAAGMLVVSCADTEGSWVPDGAPPSARDTGAAPGTVTSAVPLAGPEVPMTSPSGIPENPVLASHAQTEIEALCSLARGCCQAAGQTNFEMAKCRAAYQGYGFQGDLLGVSDAVVRGGHVTFDQSRGTKCYAEIRGLGCKNISGAAYASATNACFTALQGTLPPHAECRATVECRTGLRCESAGDEVGHCIPIKTVGDTCEQDAECGYRLNGNACDPASKACIGLLPLGAKCRLSGQCASKVCAGSCVAKLDSFIRPEECETFR